MSIFGGGAKFYAKRSFSAEERRSAHSGSFSIAYNATMIRSSVVKRTGSPPLAASVTTSYHNEMAFSLSIWVGAKITTLVTS